LKTGVLQSANRHLKIAHGDVLIYGRSKTRADLLRISEATYFAGTWSMVQADRLRATYFKQTIYAWVIQNVTKQLAERLDAALRADDAYLGVLEVDFTIPAHLILFRNCMPHFCRVQGTHCILSYSMGSEDGKDEYLAKALLDLGFADVEWEDSGAHGTIFDDFDTLEHFGRVREVEKVFASVLPDGNDEAGELVMMLEDLNPGLFNDSGLPSERSRPRRQARTMRMLVFSAAATLSNSRMLYFPRPMPPTRGVALLRRSSRTESGHSLTNPCLRPVRPARMI
jgi:hypothetical protein